MHLTFEVAGRVAEITRLPGQCTLREGMPVRGPDGNGKGQLIARLITLSTVAAMVVVVPALFRLLTCAAAEEAPGLSAAASATSATADHRKG
ncbi:MAG: hypothetical protein ACR2P1_10135 [Pseudomonadales bacterium]